MFYSQCLLSRKGPLGTIWVAAHCFKRLKKSQVDETDITSSVDKILQDEVDILTYRILAYLLLGIVRIYSKKVDYLFDDSHGVLIKIKEFRVCTKDSVEAEDLRAPYYSITLPDNFELDTFDLGVLHEDFSGGNVVSLEEITLKDNTWRNGNWGLYAADKYYCKEAGALHTNLYGDDGRETDFFLSPMEIDRTELDVSIPQAAVLSLETFLDIEVSAGIEKERPDADILLSKDHVSKALEMELPKQGECPQVDTEKPHKVNTSQRENANIEPTSETDDIGSRKGQIEEEQHDTRGEMIPSEKENFLLSGEENLSHVEKSIDKLRDNNLIQEEPVELGLSNGEKEESRALVRDASQENGNGGEKLKCAEMTSSEKEEHRGAAKDHRLSISLDGTPQSEFPDIPDSRTPEFVLIPTPPAKDRPRILKKRKCIFDELIVIPNEMVRRSILDADDLVCKRRKAPCTALAAWKSQQIFNLYHGFSEPLIHYSSSELRSLFSDSRQRILKSTEVARSSENLDMLCTPAIGLPEKENVSPGMNLKIVGTPERLDTQDSAAVRSEQLSITPEASPNIAGSEQIEIAPQTPVQSSIYMRSFGSPESPRVPESDTARSPSLPTRMDVAMDWAKDHESDLSLLNEEIGLCEGGDLNSDEWSGRTRMVAAYLDRNFLLQKKHRGEEVVNLSEVLEGKTKMESARLFYEILVLRTKGFVNVKQESTYADILLKKQSNWDQTFGAAACKCS